MTPDELHYINAHAYISLHQLATSLHKTAAEWSVQMLAVVVTFFNNNFVNCKAISNYGYQKSMK